jgi:hypothetical protein
MLIVAELAADPHISKPANSTIDATLCCRIRNLVLFITSFFVVTGQNIEFTDEDEPPDRVGVRKLFLKLEPENCASGVGPQLHGRLSP